MTTCTASPVSGRFCLTLEDLGLQHKTPPLPVFQIVREGSAEVPLWCNPLPGFQLLPGINVVSVKQLL
jgi:hypothetical protein